MRSGPVFPGMRLSSRWRKWHVVLCEEVFFFANLENEAIEDGADGAFRHSIRA